MSMRRLGIAVNLMYRCASVIVHLAISKLKKSQRTLSTSSLSTAHISPRFEHFQYNTMPRTASLLALTAASTVVIGGCSSTSTTTRLLIGDVFVKSAEDGALRGSLPSRSLNEQNESILRAMLDKETFDVSRDECLIDVDGSNGNPIYGQCDILLFPFCTGDTPNICFNRINRQDAFYPDKHPKYYIDYSRIRCYPNTHTNNVDFPCSSCSPGRWCVPEGRCILDENLYGCWAVEDAAKDEAEDDEEQIIEEEDEIINKVIENEIDTAIIEDKTVASLEEGTAAAAAAMMIEMTDVLEDKGNDDLLPSDYPTYSPIHTDYPTYMPTES